MKTYSVIVWRKVQTIESRIQLDIRAPDRAAAVKRAIDMLPTWKPIAACCTKEF